MTGAIETASATLRRAVRALLEERGVPRLGTLRNPAGLDQGARTAPEVALSILAEIVQTQPGGTGGTGVASSPAIAATRASSIVPPSAVDPVCGMQVDVATARHTAEVDGVLYDFCCASCQTRFVKQPHDHRRNSP